MSENITWLKNEVEKIQFPENAFRIYLDEGVFIIGATKSHPSSTPDFFTIATIYETISDINTKIQFSFSLAEQHGALEENKKYNPFDEPTRSERIASYFIENIAFRVGILWDMLAQLYNEYWKINTPIEKLYYTTFFHNCSQGKKGDPQRRGVAATIYTYLTEADCVKDATQFWEGNHEFAKQYRDQMTHRNSPNISSVSPFSMELRPPVSYIMKRIIEDYLKVSEFINDALIDIGAYFSSNPPDIISGQKDSN